MEGWPVLDEAIAGSGRLGDLHHELIGLEHALADPERADEAESILGAVRRRAVRIPAARRLRAGGARPRGASRARLRRRAHRRRRRRPVRRLEDARRDGEGPPRQARRPPHGRAHEPPRHRIHHLARGVPRGLPGLAPHDLPRPRLHEPRRLEDRRDRRRRARDVLGQLRLLRARAGPARNAAGSRLRPAAGDAREGAALHRALPDARREGGAGAEPRQEAREDRDDRAAEKARRRALRLHAAAALRRRRGDPRERVEGLRDETPLRRASISSSAAASAGASWASTAPERRRS